MKKIGLYLTSLFLGIFLLTSCLEGSNVREEIGYGFLDWGNGLTPVLKSSMGNFSGPSVISLYNTGAMDIGGCYAFYFRIDFDQPENSASIVETNGYQTITILQYGELTQYHLNSPVTDITQVLPNEMPLVKACNGLDYVSGYMFMSHTVYHPDDWVLTWDMSYDYSTLTNPAEENGMRYYDLYIRARIQNRTEKTSNIEIQYTNVYNVDNYLNLIASTEHAKLESLYNENTSQFTVRFNYVSDLDEATNSITWKKDEVSFYIAGFLSK